MQITRRRGALVGQLATLSWCLVAGHLLSAVSAQISDGDDSFQAYHQDIGRIQTGGSPVAANTLVRQLGPPPTATPPQPAAPVRARPQAARPREAPSKRPRVVLSIRTQPPVAPEQAFSQPAASLVESNFRPVAPQLAQPRHLEPAGPALTSFRSADESAANFRHSALMAQVAAERQALAGATQAAGPSLGQPLEALSAPAGAQVAAPPTLQQVGSAAVGQLLDRPEEPEVAPSFESVLSSGCPRKGVFSYENKDHCDRYYMCTNGTFTEEACPNGLAYSQMGAVYQHCAYNWNVDCGRKKSSEPLASPGCPWQFGIFPILAAGRCSIDYFVCEWGVPETKRCSPEGLFYDDRIKGCQWADQLGCKSEALLNFKCPAEDEDNPYWPYPRYYHTKQDVIVCVNEQPRLVHCTDDQTVEPSSLACVDPPGKKKLKKKLM